jgi:hypothetical protein
MATSSRTLRSRPTEHTRLPAMRRVGSSTKHLVNAVALALVLSASRLYAVQFPRDSTQISCQLRVSDSRPAILADGRTVHVDVQSVASRGNSVLFVGAPAYVWAKGARLHDAPDSSVAIFGGIRDAEGDIQILLSPTGRRPEAVHVASAGAAGWHVIFVEASKPPNGSAIYDSADVWYGRFDGKNWNDVRRIVTVTAAAISSSFSSDLLSLGRRVAFAFAFDHSAQTHSNSPGNQGLVVIRGAAGGWTFDTLLTRLRPNVVRIAGAATAGSLQVAIVQPYFDERLRPQPPSLFLAQLEAHWQEPRLLVRGSQGGIGSLSLEADRGRLIASWSQREPGIPPKLVALRINAESSSAADDRPIVIRDSTLAFATSSPNTDLPLWLVHALPSPTETRAVILRGTRAIDLGAVRIPNQGLHPAIVSRTDSAFLVISTALGARESDTPAVTIVSSLRLSCTGK